ncbi:MbtH family protein [Mucilaginibacter phyllosphaerae]|uniref:MbtH family NRPS accessory protein n=1 Tax=Mucilaginibacter phyllosphaerae TaxID=1812349 RepID=A0A4Y8AFT2_9SPHI|nr:MbtH family NRPS accessory protein [Mucilaginibacter phyllosphaerae]MBB3968727.1 MbtH protein [Mucilaginibacter phyllosphaerae]TEW67637.1 MbtH family NRPS accessory protein [Mucilaginibacter phyllosphaerae]GGH14258.1 hypothetical protein GCM10007352_22230 [Mucilaginibacter phyllosphaerae]
MTEHNEIFNVVKNASGQYSIYPASKEPPAGWAKTGVTGTKEECLNYIEEVWVDMRPIK